MRGDVAIAAGRLCYVKRSSILQACGFDSQPRWCNTIEPTSGLRIERRKDVLCLQRATKSVIRLRVALLLFAHHALHLLGHLNRLIVLLLADLT